MPPAPAEAFWWRDKKNRAPGAIKNPPFGGFFIGSRNRYFLGFFTAVLAAAGAAASSSTASLNSRP